MTPGFPKPSQRFECVSVAEKGKVEPRLGEKASPMRERPGFRRATGGFSLGRERPRLGEKLGRQVLRPGEDDPGQCPERNPGYHVTRSSDRKRLGLGPSRVFSDGRSGGIVLP
ncbi:unnamed protein product [Lupinus luteus]|uniref:Uncharacterized protein n=1 Tax=Lupinus luteus TaxID=3873 RepID=A0AAV1YHE8_LUPLU